MSIEYFVGRQHELDQLSINLETVMNQKEPKFFLIEGDFGQGKTALVEYFLKQVKNTYPDMLIGSGMYDALIIAAALLAGCETLYSEDLQRGQRFDEQLTVRNPFTLSSLPDEYNN